MAPVRLDLTARLCEALGSSTHADVELVEPAGRRATTLLATVHDPDYIAAVKAASADPSDADDGRGLGTEDDPAFPGMHEASARIVAGTRRRLPRPSGTGEAEHGVNFTGGLHHAMPRQRRAASASTTTSPSASSGCSTTAPSGSPTSTSTCTTATASSGSSGTTRGC